MIASLRLFLGLMLASTLLASAGIAQDAPVPGPDTNTLAAVDTSRTDSSIVSEVVDDLARASQDLAAGNFGDLGARLKNVGVTMVDRFVPRLLSALAVAVLLFLAYRLLRRMLNTGLTRAASVDAGMQGLMMRTFRIVALSFILLIVLGQFGVNIVALLAGLSVAGIAVGLAAQDTIQNYFAGITILMDRPFRVGDNVTLANIFGRVEQITLRSTRIRTQDHRMVVIPNVQAVNQLLINHSGYGMMRVDIPFGIAYKEYPDEARKVVVALAEGDDRLHPNFQPEVVVVGLNNSSVDLSLRLFINDPTDEVRVRLHYTERIREALRSAGIEIPFPHLQVFLDEAKALENTTLMLPPPEAE